MSDSLMAEGPDPVSETVLELEQEVTCGICHDHYQEPKLLPCCHYYCKQCILSLTLSSQYPPNQPFPCPDCREPTLLPGNDVDRLPTAFFINRMKELHSRMEKAHGVLKALCELCSHGKATAFCRQCVKFICEECVKSHQRMVSTVFAGHVVSTLEELKEGGVNELSVVDTPPKKCTDHDEPKKIFCFDCNHLICRDCVIFEHAGHKSAYVKKAAQETRKKLAEHLSPLKNLQADLSTAVSGVRDTKQEIQAEGELVEKQVNAKFQELHDILEQCKARVLRESRDIAKGKMEKLTVQENGLELSVERVQSLVDFVEHTLNNASDEELITMQEQVVSRIDGEVVKREKEAASADPVEMADFGVKVLVSKDFKKLGENSVIVYKGRLDPLKCIVKGDGARIADVDEPAQLTVVCGHQQEPSATLKSLVDQTSLQLEAVPVSKGVYRIEYTPKVRGRHHLQISVDGQPVIGSPFFVFVRIPPTKLDKPVRKITNIASPRYMAFNSSEEVIVTDYSKDVLILNKKGELLRSISRSEHGFKNICGVAVDKDDNVYFSDSENNCVYKFSKNGKLLKRFGKGSSGPGEFNFPRGVVVVGGQVFVCDYFKNRIQVLTTELEPVKQFGSRGTGDGQFNKPEDIAVDSEGMLYVSDFNNKRIQVFTRDGQFVRSFGKEGSGQLQGKLSKPKGVCVVGDYVYVSETDQHVSVFTKDGQFVTSFCKGAVNHGVIVDRDGFVYVCAASQLFVC